VPEHQVVGDAELVGPSSGGSDEHTAEIDASACDAVVTGPRAQHFAGATGEIEDPVARSQPECLSQYSQFVLAERVMNPMVSLPYDMLAGQFL
jgi:hypothetical protein